MLVGRGHLECARSTRPGVLSRAWRVIEGANLNNCGGGVGGCVCCVLGGFLKSYLILIHTSDRGPATARHTTADNGEGTQSLTPFALSQTN